MNRRTTKFASLLVFSACASLSAAAAEAQAEGEIFFDTFNYDGATGRTELTGPRISQGELSIEAERGFSVEANEDTSAEGDDVERTEWRFQGNVEIRGAEVRITGDTAEFVALNDALARFELSGTPARFEDLSPGDAGQAFGEAERLVYDSVDGVVSLNGEARIVIGPNAFIGCDLIYDIDTEASRSGSSECERQLIRLSPNEDAADQQAP